MDLAKKYGHQVEYSTSREYYGQWQGKADYVLRWSCTIDANWGEVFGNDVHAISYDCSNADGENFPQSASEFWKDMYRYYKQSLDELESCECENCMEHIEKKADITVTNK